MYLQNELSINQGENDVASVFSILNVAVDDWLIVIKWVVFQL